MSARSTSCSTRIRALALIPIVDYDLEFPSIFVNSVKLVHNEDSLSFATIFFSVGRDCFFFKGLFFGLVFIVSSGEKKLFFVCNVRGRCLAPQWVMSVCLPGF